MVEDTLLQTVREARKADSRAQIDYVVGDLTDEKNALAAVSRAVAQFGRLDYAVNIAGITGKVLTTDVSELDDFRQVQQVNVESLWLCEREELKVMLSQDTMDGCPPSTTMPDLRCRGSIVNLSSAFGLLGSPRGLPYVASKHAIVGITKSDALAYAFQGIRVNCVAPGYALPHNVF